MSGPPRVSFLIAGFQKAGTTALFDYLADYGDLALPEEKELHFFDDEGQDWDHPDYDAYEARFPQALGPPAGEATPIYAYWPRCLERIQVYNPAIKLILLLRDPVERAWSQWRMETRRGVETSPFGWCIREGRQRLFEAEPWGHHREFSYVERGFYAEQLARLFSLFPREQVLLLTADTLRTGPGETLGRVRAFLGLPAAAAPSVRESHVGPDLGAPDPMDVAFLRGVYAEDAENLAELTGIRFAAR